MPKASTKPAPERAWPAAHVEMRPIKSLLSYPRNARTHSPKQIAQIAASMTRWGWTVPVLVDEKGMLLAGHGRLKAANKLGISDIPVMVAAGWTEDEKLAYRLADNQIPMNAGWDTDLLKIELQDLKLGGFEVELLGFDDMQLVQFMAGSPTGADPEVTPEPPVVPVSRKGDLWLLGEHRVLCGDATSAEDVERLLDGAKPNLMVTDSPYGVDYDPNWRNEVDRADGKPYGARAVGEVTNDDQIDWFDAWRLFPGNVVYLWHAGRHASEVQGSLARAGFEVVCQIIWAKPRFVISRGDYHWQHEPCWYAVRRGKRHEWSGDRSQTTLWEIEHQKSETGHSTQKPIECMKRPIDNNSQPGDAVYDPFLGSGTTLIAADMTGRKCLGLEIAPEYVDVIIRRWQEFSGKEATLDAPGEPTYARVQADRAKPAPKRKRAPRAAERV